MSKRPSLSGGQLSLDSFLVSKTRNVKENVAPSTSSKRKRVPKDDDEYDDRAFKKDKEEKKVQIPPRGAKRGDWSTPLLHSRTVGGLQTPLSYGDTPVAKSKNKSTAKVAHTVPSKSVQPAPFPLPSPPQITASEFAYMRREYVASEETRSDVASTSNAGTLHTPSSPRRKRRRRNPSPTSPVERGFTFSRQHRTLFTPESQRVVPSSQPSLDGRGDGTSEDPFTASRARLSSHPFDFDMLPSPSIPSSTYESAVSRTRFKVPLSPLRLDLGQGVRGSSTTDEQKNDSAESPVRWNEETIPSSQSQYLVMGSSPVHPTKPLALRTPQHHSDDIVPTSQSQEKELIIPNEGNHFVPSYWQAQNANAEQSGHNSSLSSPFSPLSPSGDFQPLRPPIKPPPQLVEEPSRVAGAGDSQPDSQLQHCSFDSSQTEPDSQAISYYYPSQAHSPVLQPHTPLQAISFNGVPIQHRVGADGRKDQSMHAAEPMGSRKAPEKDTEPVSDEELAEIGPMRCSANSPSESANPKLDTVTSPVRGQPDQHMSVRDDLPNSPTTNPSHPAAFRIPRKMVTKMADIIDRLDAMTSQELEGSLSFSDVSSGGSMLEFESLPSVWGDLINGSNQDLSDIDHATRDG